VPEASFPDDSRHETAVLRRLHVPRARVEAAGISGIKLIDMLLVALGLA
jgi:hypothetical protein